MEPSTPSGEPSQRDLDVTDPLLRAHLAPEPRTLVDILRATADAHPDSPAIDNGREVLTYDELLDAAQELAAALRSDGVRRGDRVGVRIPSGTTDLYVAITGILLAGAAYVPVDHDDPDERARVVFGEAGVAAIVGTDLVIRSGPTARPDADPDEAPEEDPELTDDAWVIFTSGSTGLPKGVAVSHRNAAAFVDAESRMFLQQRPIGPGDRVMAGLSVAFDASCEEMWLAWRYGACLVPAPRSLVRSGMDLGPWLVANDITIVSTVPTLVALWPADALADVRLLILGGEACPPEIGARLATDTREVWNTYGPTEATVVACGAQLDGQPPVRIGLPLDGWDLAVVDAQGQRVPDGEPGELIIGGVGLARYLDPEKDAAVYAPMPGLGWERAYRSGDVVRFDGVGLVFQGRADDQVKVGGRRIELGEVDSALLGLPGVSGAAAAVKRTEAGNRLLVGYVTADAGVDAGRPRPAYRRRRHPAHPHLREDRPRRPAVAATRRVPRNRCHGIRHPRPRARRHGRLDRRALGRHPRLAALRPRRGLLRPRWGEPQRSPAGLQTARTASGRHRRRHLRAPRPRRPRADPRRHGRADRPHQRLGLAGPARHPGRAGARHRRRAVDRGAALADVDRARAARRAPGRGCRASRGAGCSPGGCSSSTPSGGCCSVPPRRAWCCAGSALAGTPAVAGCTCGSGSPSDWSTS